jgi:hypothetical protein
MIAAEVPSSGFALLVATVGKVIGAFTINS